MKIIETGSPKIDNQTTRALKVFYSYSHKDSDLINELALHLQPLREEGLIEDWADDEILAGASFNEEIHAKLDEADIVLLLVSIDFLNSDYVRKYELPHILERERQGGACVIPLLARPFANWREHYLFADRQAALPTGDSAISVRKNRDVALTRVAEKIRLAALNWREKKVSGSEVSGSNLGGVRVEFVCAPIDASMFRKIDENPYKDFYSPDDADDLSITRVFLWLPSRSTLTGELPEYSTMAVICDAGKPELEKFGRKIEQELSRVQAYYKTSPANLKPKQREDFARLAGQVLQGTFVMVAAVPKLLLGKRLDDPNIAYEFLLNLSVLPLAAGHASLHFQRFELKLSPIDETGLPTQPMTAHAKRLVKALFNKPGSYDVTYPLTTDPGYFYLYAARFVQWAANRQFNENTPDWLEKLRGYFA